MSVGVESEYPYESCRYVSVPRYREKFMFKRMLVIGTVLATSLLTGCDLSGKKDASPLVGTWVYYDGPLSTTYQFNADGSCTKFVSVPDSVPANDRPGLEKGTWSVDDTNENLDLAFSNGSPDPVEEPHRIKLTSTTLAFNDGAWNPVFRRAR